MIPLEVIKKVIVEYQQFIETVELHERSYGFETNGKYVMVGVRHAGKSYLLYQRARQFLAAGSGALLINARYQSILKRQDYAWQDILEVLQCL